MSATSHHPTRRSFERLYREHFAFVWAAARGFGVPSGALEDATQDVFVTAYRKLDQIRPEVSPRGWLYGVTRRIAHRYRRGLARQARRHAAYAHEPRVDAHEPDTDHDATRWLRRALRDLEPAQRETFVMAELLGMSGPEIAAQQGVPVNTVYSRVRLARKQLLRRSDSPDHLHARIGEIRRGDAPSAEQHQRVWIALMPAIDRIPEGIAALAQTSSAATTMGWIGAAIVVAGAGALVLAGRPTPSDRARARSVIADRALPSSGERPQSHPQRVTDSPSETSEPSEAAHERATTALLDPARRPAKVSPAAESTVASRDAGLSEELELLDRAQQALDRRAAKEALAWVDQHARRFRTGQLADVREAARVAALCQLGRLEEAERAHAALLEAHPGSSIVRSKTIPCW